MAAFARAGAVVSGGVQHGPHGEGNDRREPDAARGTAAGTAPATAGTVGRRPTESRRRLRRTGTAGRGPERAGRGGRPVHGLRAARLRAGRDPAEPRPRPGLRTHRSPRGRHRSRRGHPARRRTDRAPARRHPAARRGAGAGRGARRQDRLPEPAHGPPAGRGLRVLCPGRAGLRGRRPGAGGVRGLRAEGGGLRRGHPQGRGPARCRPAGDRPGPRTAVRRGDQHRATAGPGTGAGGGRRDPRGVSRLGPVFRILSGSQGPARTSAALSSLADAPRRLPPPPCICTHQTPLGSAGRHRQPEPT
ncbi:hypothetical protein SGPA1_50636 [Streptomyces misionensis JCM 4497]